MAPSGGSLGVASFYFGSCRCKMVESHSNCANLKKAHTLFTPCNTGSEAFLPIGTTRVRKWYNAVTVLIWRPKFLLSKDGTDESSRPAHGSLTTNCQYARRPVLAAGNGQGRFVHRKIDGLSSRAIRA